MVINFSKKGNERTRLSLNTELKGLSYRAGEEAIAGYLHNYSEEN